VPGGLQGPDAGGQACLPPAHQLDHYGAGARVERPRCRNSDPSGHRSPCSS
jgi:hypothetical protein